jgi:hypothetical protein
LFGAVAPLQNDSAQLDGSGGLADEALTVSRQPSTVGRATLVAEEADVEGEGYESSLVALDAGDMENETCCDGTMRACDVSFLELFFLLVLGCCLVLNVIVVTG